MSDPAPVNGQPGVPAVPGRRPEGEATETPPVTLWDRMRQDPQYAPEHLALEAVRRLGPEAATWVRQARAQHPNATPDSLADQVVRRFVNQARLSGAVSGAAGLPGAVLDVGVLAWTQARMVLHIAAAYGADPAHQDRAADLLVLQKVHKVAASARLALGVAAGRERAGALFGGGGQTTLGRAMLRLGIRLAQMAGVRAAKRVFAKVVPGAAIILGTWANSSATKNLAERSRAHYRQHGHPHIPTPRRSPEDDDQSA
ncbi:EcsC family protein [Micromonospora sp. NPDC048871]|uniref:EcsC family protein n=1 Tax=unclassified Micromonospora TaxID=2617518 RepID=UPI002E150EE0|nr:EcsC family protein [Micromonospora sp. NBC_01739]